MVVATMLALHWVAGTWRNAVDLYIALSQVSRAKLIKGGLPAAKIMVKPNFVSQDLDTGSGEGGYVAFVGRLSDEKGLETLINAWRLHRDLPTLKIVGDGPIRSKIEEIARGDRRIHLLRRQPLDVVYSLIGEAACLILPSECYENCPRVIIEAFARGTPAVVSELGAMAELVDNGRTGAHFRCGDPDDLAAKLRRVLADPASLRQMRRSARLAYEEAFTEEKNHRQLMSIYQQALRSRAQREASSWARR